METGNYIVSPAFDGWIITREGEDVHRAFFKSKEVAWKEAVDRTYMSGGVAILKNKDDKVVEQSQRHDYSDAPYMAFTNQG